MNFNGSSPFFVFLSTVATLLSLLTTVFWVVVGWRAMRAHEELAQLLREKRGP